LPDKRVQDSPDIEVMFETISLIIFITALSVLLLSYVIYPLMIWILSSIAGKKFKVDSDYRPKVSLIVSALNEEKNIEKTIRRILESDYPTDKIEILVGSDGSTDHTADVCFALAKEYSQVRVFDFKQNRGKAIVLNDLVKEATGEILAYADANSWYRPHSLKKLVQYYSDVRVGGVSGRLILHDGEDDYKSNNQEKVYWAFESWLKKCEGKMGTLIGAMGPVYSIRKDYFKPFPVNVPVNDDFYSCMKVLEQGKSFLYEHEAVVDEIGVPNLKYEFKRKTRIQSLNFGSLSVTKNLLHPKFGLIALSYLLHKVFRWFTPILIILIMLSTLVLSFYSDYYLMFFGLQMLFIFFSLAGLFLHSMRIYFKPFLLFSYFLMMNLAFLKGMFRYFLKLQSTTWEPAGR